MKKTALEAHFDWQAWESEPEDLKALGLPILKHILFNMFLINEFERAVLDLKEQDCVWGPVHASIGQEACAAGSVAALRVQDKITGTHRAHHQFLAKLMNWALPKGWDPISQDIPKKALEAIRRGLAEIMGLAPGYCGGRGGSMHLRFAEAGVLGTNAIVGGGTALSAGAAFSEKMRGVNSVVVCFLGDGAAHQGVLHEACNLAGLWNLPIIYFIENNLYAVGTSTEQASAVKDLSVRAASYNMSARIVNGADPIGIYAAVKDAAESIRAGGSPFIIEAKCYRHCHHAGSKPGSAFGYRSKEEEAACLASDALTSLPENAERAGLLKKPHVERMRELAKSAVAQAVDFCTVKSGNTRLVRKELWPSTNTLYDGVRSGGREWADVEFRDTDLIHDLTEMKFPDAIAEVTRRWMDRDRRVVVMGEEVANFGGGAYGATKGLAKKYPKRVLNTPISEAGFVGLACGAAMTGLLPVVEIMFPDFSMVAVDQLFNQVGKLRYIYGDTVDMPLVARTRVGIGCGYGAQHSMDPTGLYALWPGWRVVYPSNALDYIGLFNSAMTSLDPVLIIEHNAFYALKFPVPKSDWDYCIPFGKARVALEGKDATLVTYGPMVSVCRQVASSLAEGGVSLEVIDLRTVDPTSIDYATIGASVAKTGAVAVVEQAPGSHSIGSVIAAEVSQRFFDCLDCPVMRISSPDVPTPVSRVLEAAAFVDEKTVFAAVGELLNAKS